MTDTNTTPQDINAQATDQDVIAGAVSDDTVPTGSAQIDDLDTDTVALANETELDDVCVIETNDVPETSVIIEPPAAGESHTVAVQPGIKYFFDFAEEDVESFVKSGDDLTITLADGGVVVLAGLADAVSAEIPATLSFQEEFFVSQFSDLIEVVETVPSEDVLEEPESEVREEEESGESEAFALLDAAPENFAPAEDADPAPLAEELAQAEPAAGQEPSVQNLAQIEPAAGEQDGGESDNSGYGFQSSFDPQGVQGLDDVGPIDPTQLMYGIPQQEDETFVPEGPLAATVLPILASPVQSVVDETDFSLGDLTVSDQVDFDFSGEDPETVAPNDVFNVTCDVPGYVLTSGGQQIDVTLNGDGTGYVGTIDGGQTVVFTIVIDPETGNYTYTQILPIDHPIAGDNSNNEHDDAICLEFGVEATNGDDVADTTITIIVEDDGPLVFSQGDPQVVDESDLDDVDSTPGVDTVDGQFAYDPGQDGLDEILGTNTLNVTCDVPGYVLTSGGEVVNYTFDAATNTYIGHTGNTPGVGNDVYMLEIDPTDGSYTFTLIGVIDHPIAGDNSNGEHDDAICIEFGVQVVDGDGDTADGLIAISIHDDGPVAVADTNTVEGGQSISGNVIVNDDFGADGAGTEHVVSVNGAPLDGNPIAGTYGSLVINADGTYTYTANSNAPNATETFTYTIIDADGDTSTTTLTITVQADDIPVLVDVTPGIVDESDIDDLDATPDADTVSGQITVDFGSDTPGTITGTDTWTTVGGVPLTSNGEPVVITFDAATNTYTGTANGEDIFTLVINADTGAYDFTLTGTIDHPNTADHNDAVTVQFGFTATDSEGDALVTPGTINITILDDGPVAVADTNAVEGGQSVSGNVIVNDDFGADGAGTEQVLSVNGAPLDGNPIAGTYGSLVMNADGTYTYTANDDAPNATEVFTYTIIDADGDTSTTTLTITVREDDIPVIVSVTPGLVDESDIDDLDATPDADTVSGQITVDFGSDTPGTITGTDTWTTVGGVVLTSGGEPVVITFDAATNTYTGTANGEDIFTLVINAETGAYDFTLTGTIDHPNTADHNDAVTVQFGFTATDSEGDALVTPGTIDITILDDGPRIANPEAIRIDEDGLVNGPVSVDGVLEFDFGEDGEGQIEANGTPMAIVEIGQGPVTLTSGGEPVTMASLQNGNGYVGTLPDGTIVFTITIDPSTGEYTYTQNLPVDHPDSNDPNEAIWIKFPVQIVDADGDTADATIVIDVVDSAPVAVEDTETATGGETIDGNVFDNDTLSVDEDTVVTTVDGQPVDPVDGLTITTTNGTLHINPDGTYTYTAGDDVNGVDVFTYTIIDADGDTSTTTLTIDVSTVLPEIDVNIVGDHLCVLEDGSLDLPLELSLENVTGDHQVTITLSDIPSDWGFASNNPSASWAYNPVTGDYTLTVPGATFDGMTAAEISEYLSVSLTPPENSDVDAGDITVTASVHDAGMGLEAGTIVTDSDVAEVVVDAVADEVDLEADDTSHILFIANGSTELDPQGGNTIDISHLGVALIDVDGSEEITAIYVTIPESLLEYGAELNYGVEVEPGVWLLTADELNSDDLSIEMDIDPDVDTTFPVGIHEVTVAVHSAETALNGDECDLTNNENVTETSFDIHILWSPLALDLNGDGMVNHLAYDDGGVLFDIDADGDLDLTGWISGEDGLLALDVNGDGLINDGSELFGNAVQTGFMVLSSYDTNGDNIIDANDSVWADLVVWQDVNQDGISQGDEMFTMDMLGIQSINLDSTGVYIEENGNVITDTSTFTYEDGTESTIVDVWFAFDDNVDETLTPDLDVSSYSVDDNNLDLAVVDTVDAPVVDLPSFDVYEADQLFDDQDFAQFFDAADFNMNTVTDDMADFMFTLDVDVDVDLQDSIDDFVAQHDDQNAVHDIASFDTPDQMVGTCGTYDVFDAQNDIDLSVMSSNAGVL